MNTFALALKYFFVDLFGGIIRWPFWWYTRGLVLVIGWSVDTVKMYAKTLAISVWIKNIFVPMFGFYDWQSRLISFIMRVANIIGRSIALFILILIVILFLAMYLLILPVSVGFFIYQLQGVIF
ncbi:hypothetical protein D6827_02390 [Candidatus Parcubacteria bacterium]|nr:MAG: hypothetical protein D6827_02390 [Candidatus Parcubacteria bacterium]